MLRNAILLALLQCKQSSQRDAWCIAVLRLACYPALSYLQRITELSWSETLDLFDRATEEFDLSKDISKPNIRNRLRSIARTLCNRERRETNAQRKTEQLLAEETERYPLADIFSGDSADPLAEITEEHARSLLTYLAHKPEAEILVSDIEPILRKLFHSDTTMTPTERKRRERALNRIESEKSVTKINPLGKVYEETPRKKGK